MFRFLTYGRVRNGEWRDFYRLWERLDQAIGAKNLRPATLWGQTVGPNNAFMISTDYETIGEFHGDNRSYQRDADCMSIWREMSKLLADGSLHAFHAIPARPVAVAVELRAVRGQRRPRERGSGPGRP